ncbi:MAG: DUF4153 domain-containing protein, partial [Pseudomonadota bacterium]
MNKSDIDERVPQGGVSLVTVFALPGLVLGALFYLITLAIPDSDGYPLPEAALLATVLGGFAYALVVFNAQVLRAGLSALALAVVVGVLYFIAQGGQGAQMSERVIPIAANLGIFIVALPFLRAASRERPLNDYTLLYGDAWNIPAIGGVAVFFVLIGSALAALVAALFAFIGLEFVRDLMMKPWFVAGYGGMLLGVGIGVVRQRESAVLGARGILMALVRVTAPVYAVCITVFTVALTLRGYTSLPGDISPVATLVAAAVVAIIMINAIVGDAGRPESLLFGAAERLLAVLLVFLIALAVNGLLLRVGAEGWTPNRIAAAFVMLVVALYAPIYFVAGLTEQWAILRQGNIAVSAVLIVIAVFVQTPFFRPYDWSANSQMKIIEAAPEQVQDTDLAYLRDSLGEPGKRAFEKLKVGRSALASKARELPEFVSPGIGRHREAFDQAIADGTVRFYPSDTVLEDADYDLIAAYSIYPYYRDTSERFETVFVAENDGFWVVL